MTRVLLPVLLFLTGFACSAKAPVRTSFHDGADADTIVLFFPGFAATDRTIAKKGVVEAMRDAGLDADVLTIDARFGYYVSGDLVVRLREDVMPLARKYEHIWVMGISMGGFGTLMTAEAFREDVDGIVLYSPFLGRPRVTKAVMEAGSIQAWTPPAASDRQWDDDIWVWLKEVDAGGYDAPVVYYGRGEKEDGELNRFFEDGLPDGRTRTAPGGHVWSAWRTMAAAFVGQELQAYEAFAQAPEGAAEQGPQGPPLGVSSEASIE